MSEQYLLSVQDLHTTFRTDSGEVQAVNGVSSVSYTHLRLVGIKIFHIASSLLSRI